MNAQPEIHRLRLRAIVGNLVTSMNFHRDVLNVHEITAVSAASSNLLQVANPLKLNRQGEKRPGAGPGVYRGIAYPTSAWRKIGACLFRFSGVGGDGDLDAHSQVVGREPRPGTMQRYCLARIAHHRHTNEVAVTNDAIGWIEINPTGSRQIDLCPSVRVAAALIAFVVVIGDVQISGDKARSHAKGTHSFDHQHGKVTTAPASEFESLERDLNALLIPAYVVEGPFDAVGEVDQKLAGIGWSILSQKCSNPLLNMAIWVDRLSFDEREQVGHLFRAVDERTGPGEVLNIEVVNVRARMIKTNGAVEPELLGTASEARDVEVVTERVLLPAYACWCRGNQKFYGAQTLVMAVKRTQHHPVLTEGNRLPILVGSDMPDGQSGHRDTPIDVQYDTNDCTTFASVTETA